VPRDLRALGGVPYSLRARVLLALADGGHMTAVDVANVAGMADCTARVLLRELEAEHYVARFQSFTSSMGRPAHFWRLA
jgi:predicted ArsR family transcriptional regulator